MTIKVSLTLEGLKELEANLRALPTRWARNAIRRSLMKAADVMVSAMQAKAPTNRLRVRIVSSGSLSKRQKALAKTGRKPWEVTVYVGSRPLRHAHLVEFGSGPRYNKNGAYRGTMPATPYVRPGFDGSAQQVLVDFGAILGPDLERTATRWGRKQVRSKLKVN